MNSEELSAAVDELDTRMERLRVLYEQYFQGIEKIPPLIVQKDVDRRIWVLRREKIRNTGTRFKFQQIIQRYNTFGSYWMRIMREIENGTYKRDVLRAKKRFGVDVVHPNAKVEPVDKPLERDTRDTRDARDTRDDEVESLDHPSHDLSLDDLEDDTGTFDDEPMVAAPRPTGAAPPASPARPATSSLLMSKAPPARPPTAVPPARPPTAVPPARPPTPVPSARPANPLAGDDDLDDMLDMALGPAARTPAKPAPAPVAKPAPAPMARPAPAAPAARPQPTPPPVARPQPPAAAAAPPAPKPQPAAPAAHVANPGSEEYRRVYAAYVDARRKNGESTAGLTYDALAKSLKDTTEKLKPKTGGKAIDFEVTTKDGRTILKPVVK